LTPDEAEAVFLSGLPGPAAELGLGTVVAAARLKVMAALPPDLRTRANRVSERFHLDAPGWFQQSEELPYLETLAGAVWESFLVLITYRRGERAGVVERLVEPLGLVLKGGVWYLVARTGESMRTYRVSRVLDVRVQPERFERPAGFDLAEHWTRSTLAYERDRERVWVTIRVGKEHSGRIEETIDDKFLADAEWLTEPDSAHIRVRIGFDWTDEAVTAAMRLGSDAEVVEPEWVRTTVVSSAEAVLDRYRGLSVAGRG
jgi:predicted DNA-binding transcriptional regulator YafY